MYVSIGLPTFSGGLDSQLNKVLGYHDHTLAISQDQKVDGKTISVSLQRVTPIGIVEDKAGGFCVRIIRDPKIQKIYGNGLVLYENTLRLTGRGGLTNRDYQKYLRSGIFYEEEDIELLVCEVIPDLQKKIPVDVRTTKLPPSHKVTPYLLIDLMAFKDAH